MTGGEETRRFCRRDRPSALLRCAPCQPHHASVTKKRGAKVDQAPACACARWRSGDLDRRCDRLSLQQRRATNDDGRGDRQCRLPSLGRSAQVVGRASHGSRHNRDREASSWILDASGRARSPRRLLLEHPARPAQHLPARDRNGRRRHSPTSPARAITRQPGSRLRSSPVISPLDAMRPSQTDPSSV